MTSSQADKIAGELSRMNQSLGDLIASQRAHGRELAEIKARVKETNGRVTALEKREIAERAVAEEREKTLEDLSVGQKEARDHRARLQDRGIGAIVTLIAVVLGAVLADLNFF